MFTTKLDSVDILKLFHNEANYVLKKFTIGAVGRIWQVEDCKFVASG